MKTMEQWNGSKMNLTDFLKVGDIVSEDIQDYFIETLPPETYTSNIIQLGEVYTHDNNGTPFFITLEKVQGVWTYTGIKKKINS